MKPGLLPEEAIIGCIGTEPEKVLPKIKDTLKYEHFENRVLAQIYNAILDMNRMGEGIDAVSIINLVKSEDHKQYVASIFENYPGTGNVDYYRDAVIKSYHERRLKKHLTEGIELVDGDVIKKISEEWKGIESLGARKFDFKEKAMEYVDVLEKRTRNEETVYLTGFRTLDYKVPLLRRGEMCVVGARTSIGKTSLLLSMMLKMAHQGLKVLYCSGEMSFKQLMDRIISIETKIPLLDLRRGNIQKSDWPKISSSLDAITQKNIQFVESAHLSFEKFMPYLIQSKPDVLFIDYIQRFMSDSKSETRSAFYSDIANGLKGVSVENDLVVIAASQLGRSVEQRKDEPRLSDLKESGGLEEAADVVWMIHVDEKEKINSERKCRMMILKNRNGPTFTFGGKFISDTAMFMEDENEVY